MHFNIEFVFYWGGFEIYSQLPRGWERAWSFVGGLGQLNSISQCLNSQVFSWWLLIINLFLVWCYSLFRRLVTSSQVGSKLFEDTSNVICLPLLFVYLFIPYFIFSCHHLFPPYPLPPPNHLLLLNSSMVPRKGLALDC